MFSVICIGTCRGTAMEPRRPPKTRHNDGSVVVPAVIPHRAIEKRKRSSAGFCICRRGASGWPPPPSHPIPIPPQENGSSKHGSPLQPGITRITCTQPTRIDQCQRVISDIAVHVSIAGSCAGIVQTGRRSREGSLISIRRMPALETSRSWNREQVFLSIVMLTLKCNFNIPKSNKPQEIWFP